MSEVYAYLGVGVIFVVLGTASLLGKLPLNYLAGIRIPSVMASPRAWKAGHRAAAPVMLFWGTTSCMVALAAALLRVEAQPLLTVWLVAMAGALIIMVRRAATAARKAQQGSAPFPP